MSTFLFSVWEGGGDTPPSISLIRALTRAGHEVTALADPVLASEVEEAGATVVPWTTAPHKFSYSPDEDLARDWEARTPLGQFKRFREGIAFGPARAYAHDVAAELERRRPDLAVSPIVMFGAQAAAEAAGVRQAVLLTTAFVIPGTGGTPFGSGWTLPRTRAERLRHNVVDRLSLRLWGQGAQALNLARADLGLPPVDNPIDQLHTAERFLVLTSGAFDFVPPSPPANVRWVGPRLDDPAWSGTWTPPEGDDPLVLVSLSSTYMAQEDTLSRIATALGELPVRGVITLGPALEGTRIETPPNVTVLQAAPHAEILRHAAAAIHHGGHGTTIKTLAAGVPALVLPAGRDQPDNAARVVAANAGLRLKPSAKPPAIRNAVQQLLTESRYRAGAQTMAAHIAADTRTDLALKELETLAAGRPLPAAA